MGATARQEALKRLDVLVGEWVVEAEFPGLEVPPGRSVFEWTLDGQFLVQRTEAPNPLPTAWRSSPPTPRRVATRSTTTTRGASYACMR